MPKPQRPSDAEEDRALLSALSGDERAARAAGFVRSEHVIEPRVVSASEDEAAAVRRRLDAMHVENGWPPWAKILLRQVVERGSVTGACARAAITRSAVYRYAERHPEFQAALDLALSVSTDQLARTAVEVALGKAWTRRVLLLDPEGQVLGERRVYERDPKAIQWLLARRGPEWQDPRDLPETDAPQHVKRVILDLDGGTYDRRARHEEREEGAG